MTSSSETADQLILALSQEAGSYSDNSPFVSKDLIWLQDNNLNSTYSNQVVFETQQWANNSKFMNYPDGFVVLPIICHLNRKGTSLDFTDVGTDALPSAVVASDFALALKNCGTSLIHSVQIDYGNSSVVSKVDNINQYLAFKQHTELSLQEEELHGSLLNYAFDNADSWSYNSAASSIGNGLCNNCNGSNYFSGGATDLTGEDFNSGMQKRQRYSQRAGVGPSNASNGQTLIMGGATQVDSMYKKLGLNFIENTNGAKYYYYNVVIPLKHLHPLFSSSDFPRLLRGSVMRITLNINTVFFEFTKSAAGALTGPSNLQMGGGVNPILVASTYKYISRVPDGTGGTLDQRNSLGAITSPTTTGVACGSAGLPVAEYQVSLSIVTSRPGHTFGVQKRTELSSCRLYAHAYSMVSAVEQSYLALGQKRVKFLDLFVKEIYNVEAGQSFNHIITAGIKRPKRMIIIPYLNNSNYSEISSIPELNSCWSTCPATCAPLLLQDVGVFVGGVNMFRQNMNYSYETFLNEMNVQGGLYSNLITGSCAGRIGLKEWQSGMYNYYVVDLRRMAPENIDTLVPINITGRVASLKSVNFYVWIEQEVDNFVIDLRTGQRVI